MKALHVITGLGVGGAEQQLRLLVRNLPVDCDVVTLTNPGAVAEGLAADGVRVTHLGMRGNRDLAALPRLVRLIRRGRYDLVHTHLYRACVYGRFAARLAGVRAVVATEHSLGDSQLEGRRLTSGVRALYLASERLGRSTVAVSPTVAERLRRWGVPGPRIEVVPNGIDVARFRFDPALRASTRRRLGLPQDAYVVGAVGRLTPGKRFEVLVRALAALPDTYWLLLVGGGPEESALRRAAQRGGVADRVLFTGERPNGPAGSTGTTGPAGSTGSTRSAGTAGAAEGIGSGEPSRPDASDGLDLPALATAMDVLASPSADEAFGLAVVEALAAGLPVLYVSCPAVADLPPDAAPLARRVQGGADAFAQALRQVRARGPGPRSVPDAAHHYSIARSADRLMDIYTAATLGVSSA